MAENINKTANLGLNKSPENNYDYLSYRYKELLNENWEKLDMILADKEINIKQYGALGDGKNYTKEIQTAIDNLPADGGVLFVPPGLYLINTWSEGSETTFPLGGISLRSNMILHMAPGAIFKAIPNNYPDYTILRATGQENIMIIGGTFIGDRYEHKGATGQWGFGISIIGSKNVIIKDVTVIDCWGDGIYIGPNRNQNSESQNIKIFNCKSTNNRRQGLNITGCINALIENSIFNDSNGYLPEAGINLEPLNSNNIVQDIIINNCYVTNNKGAGIRIYTGTKNAIVKSNIVRFNNDGIYVKLSDYNKIQQNTIEENNVNGIYIDESKYNIIESNTSIKNKYHGIALNKSSHNLIDANISMDNGLAQYNTYDNIALWNASSYNNIKSNMVRLGTYSDSSRYGISILESNCYGNFVVGNDLLNSGSIKEFHDAGTNTIDSSNRKKDSEFSIDAKSVKISDTNNIITALNVDEALDEIFDKLKKHIEQTIDAHDASAISLTDPGNKTTKTNVEDAIQELYDEIKKARTYAP